MNECSGLFGKWFGHKFVSLKKISSYKQPPNISFDIYGVESVNNFLNINRDEFLVICKRCGQKKS